MGVDELQILIKPYADQTGGAIWDYWLYVIIVLQFVLLVLLFQGSLRDVIMIAAAMLAAVMDKLYIFGFVDPGAPGGNLIADAVWWHTLQSFYTWGARILIFAAPLLITTQTKISKAKPAAILVALVSLVYVFGRWAFQIRLDAANDKQTRSSIDTEIYLAQSGILLLVGAEYLYHRWRTRNRE